MSESRADLFLTTFNKIESHLRRELGKETHVSFKRLVETQADRQFGPVRSNKHDLKQLADLRNAIVHNPRKGGAVIADPRPDVLERIKELWQLISDPPEVYPLFAGSVKAARRDDSVGGIIQAMQQHDFSQVPIVDDKNTVTGLLTTNTIARWVGANLEKEESGREILLTETTAVADVQEHAERTDNLDFLSRNATLFEAAAAFHTMASDRGPTEAVLITHNGKPSEELLGIITMADLPSIHHKLST